MKIESEFKNAMAMVYPTLEKDSIQYKTSRVLFYMGAHVMVTSKRIGSTQNEVAKASLELYEALKLSVHFAKKGLHPEDTLADYVEGKEQ